MQAESPGDAPSFEHFGYIAGIVRASRGWEKTRSWAKPVGAYIGVWAAFNLFRAFGDDVPWRDRWLDVVPRLEAWLFDGKLPTVRLQDRFYDPSHVDWLDWSLTLVYLSFFVVPHLVAIVLMVRDCDRFRRYVSASALLFLFGVICFAILPTDPPWRASVTDAGGQTLRVVNSVLATVHLGSANNSASAQHGFDPNSVATMPSIHFGVTALLSLLAPRGIWRMLAIAYMLAMGLALVYLGEHYVIDVMVGGIAAAIAWKLSSLVVAWVNVWCVSRVCAQQQTLVASVSDVGDQR